MKGGLRVSWAPKGERREFGPRGGGGREGKGREGSERARERARRQPFLTDTQKQASARAVNNLSPIERIQSFLGSSPSGVSFLGTQRPRWTEGEVGFDVLLSSRPGGCQRASERPGRKREGEANKRTASNLYLIISLRMDHSALLKHRKPLRISSAPLTLVPRQRAPNNSLYDITSRDLL